MFGINGYEFVLLALIAVIVLGPERLPEYASQLAQLVKGLRRMATGAREQLREEVGSEFDDVDWRKLDPRQYDPRRIIKEALLDDIEDAIRPVSENGSHPQPRSSIAATSRPAPGSAPESAATAAPAAPRPAPLPRLAEGQAAPYDAEAT
ncbi:Sec-independent protein translocase TatB [Arthrobacter sp. JZ12]|uniref:Sec-independent protein translocase TatB n=1 Tax=Arthrobacter sp. JZ12 TaxID=2654190 RepID=UPI002B4A15CC|nr:Sec-independent protein translocase TatB [Arthrobacter sp. JZ12]WRH25474.1 Sec-independent protein translocase TatB [Arthrobacter sp. JZ12]